MTEETNFTREERNFAQEVARERQDRGWTLAEMAEKLEAAGVPSMSVMSVSRVENEKRHVSMVEAGAYAKVLGRTIQGLQHPDPREALLTIFDMSRRRALDSLTKLQEAAKEFAEDRSGLMAKVEAVGDMYGDPDKLDPDTRQRVQNFITAAHWVTGRDPVTEVARIVQEGSRRGKPEATD